jgi:hypothetical protein
MGVQYMYNIVEKTEECKTDWFNHLERIDESRFATRLHPYTQKGIRCLLGLLILPTGAVCSYEMLVNFSQTT